MRLTEQQRREKAARVAVARAAAERGLDQDQSIAAFIGLTRQAYYVRKKSSFLSRDMTNFCKMANKLGFTDQEIIRIVRGLDAV